MRQKSAVSVAVLDLQALAGFFRSVALQIEIQAGTRLEWKEYRESTVLNITYALMPWKGKPGTAEITQDWDRIRRRTDERAVEMLLTFLERLFLQGPAAAASYVESMDELRQYSRRAVQDLFSDAQQINAGVAGTAGQAARNLAVIQFGCTVLLATTGCWVALGGAVPAVMMGGMTATQMAGAVGAVNLSYNVAGALVKDGLSWKSAQAIGIELGKEGFKGRADPWLANRATEAAREVGAQKAALEEAERKIAKMSDKLAGKLGADRRARYMRGVVREGAAAEAARAKMAQNAMMRGGAQLALKAIPIVYLAHDIYNAVGDLQGTWTATR